MNIEFIPSVCTKQKVTEGKKTIEVPATFEGKIVLRVPTLTERYELLEKLGMDVAMDGTVTFEKKAFTILKQLLEESKKYFVNVDLKRLSDGKRYSSFEELEEDPSCDEILTEVAKQLRSGFQVPKK